MHNKPDYLRTDNYYHLDNLKDGFHFEEYTAELLKALDFKNVKVLPMSNDYGADVLAEYNGVKYAIQCKYYTSQTVGVKSVQEILGGTAYHNADKPVVATNYKFSPNAIKLARANKVILWDRKFYQKMINTVGYKMMKKPYKERLDGKKLAIHNLVNVMSMINIEKSKELSSEINSKKQRQAFNNGKYNFIGQNIRSKIIIQNERTKEYKKVKVGFSGTSLFFGVFLPIFRKDFKGFIFQLALVFLTAGISWFTVPFVYNKRYLQRMLENGWVVVE